MRALRREGTTIVVVSHDLHAVQLLCPRTVVIDGGRRVFDGDTPHAVSTYHDVLAAAPDGGASPADGYRRERDAVTADELRLLDAAGRPTAHVTAGEPVRVQVRARCTARVERPFAVVQVKNEDGSVVYSDSNVLQPYPALEPGDTALWEVELSSRLPSGSYAVVVSVARAAEGADLPVAALLDDIAVLASPAPLLFYVAGRPMVHGTADLEGRFRLAEDPG
jgi:lipopolysaccharide transport system ATP-binding protein